MRRLITSTLIGLAVLIVSFHNVEVNAETPSETECRPYIEKAIHELQSHDNADGDDSQSVEAPDTGPNDASDDENRAEDDVASTESGTVSADENETDDNQSDEKNESTDDVNEEVTEHDEDSGEEAVEGEAEDNNESNEEANDGNAESGEEQENNEASNEEDQEQNEASNENNQDNSEASKENTEEPSVEIVADEPSQEETEETAERDQNDDDSIEDKTDVAENSEEGNDAKDTTSNENEVVEENADDNSAPIGESENDTGNVSEENKSGDESDDQQSTEVDEEAIEPEVVQSVEAESQVSPDASVEDQEQPSEVEGDSTEGDIETETKSDEGISKEEPAVESVESKEESSKEEDKGQEAEGENSAGEESSETAEQPSEAASEEEKSSEQSYPEDDLLLEFEVPTNLRDRTHVAEILRLDEESKEKEAALNKASDVILKELKRIYDNAIKPLETLYKYRDLSNRHFGDPEIFSKPLVLFMGPWSGGKSTILNYLTDNEYTPHSIRTGAEPSPAYFNIVMHGDEPEVLDGTQLAADWTFSGLQKFGQGLEDRLRGQKLPSKFLEKVNIVEIPGILEVRKQVSRLFPFNDACQWFIDRADIIFLVYDPSKLDVGPETEAILDQLKGREYQTRIILNKGDQVKPEELLRVQSALIWNISPLMSSAQPPVMYTTSLWSHPYETGAPIRLLHAHERAFLQDLRLAIDKRIENKIASARRFAVRVRNHAKMVDCYLTTYYNHKTLFGNKKQIAEQIITRPQDYHIYEGLSTLTNISRYDLPDPDVYKDFFRLNSLYEFKKLSETCTYFRGCPINKLDIAIAYDLPELVGKYKKLAEAALVSLEGKGKS